MIDPTQPSTTAPPLHYELVASKLPDWVVNATPAQRQLMRAQATRRDSQIERACQEHPEVAQALVQTYGHHLQAETRLQALLATVPPLQQYATDLLSTAISERFGTTLDVSQTYLMNLNRAKTFRQALSSPGEDPLATSSSALKLATQSLLHSALQNFEAYEAEPGGLSAGSNESAILDRQDVSLLSTAAKLPIVAEDFAALARELDIGGKYQVLLDSLDPPATHADAKTVYSVFAAAERATFRLHVHQALLLGKIDKAIHETLLKLDSDSKVEHDGHPVLCASVELLHASLTGAMAIGVDTRIPRGAGRFPPASYPYGGWLVLYLPGMPEPLSQHASRADAEAFLLKQLPAFRSAAGLQLIPERHKHSFLDKLTDTLEPFTWVANGQYQERVPDPNARVTLYVHPFTQPFLEQRVTQRQERLRDDGLFHAAPTATLDDQTTKRQLGYFKFISLTIANIASLYIPPLAAVMFSVATVQLANETFEGIGSWLDGDRQQAFDYLMDVIENVGIMAALAAASTANGRPVIERIPVETPSFIEELKPVELPNGDRRLWYPDLTPFAHDRVLPAGLKADEFGLLHHDGKSWLPVEDRVFSVKRAENGYRLEHPNRPQGYQPKALHNGAGAWLLETERPLSWSAPRLLHRMGHLSAHFDETTLQRILEVSALHEDTLRRTLVENGRLPALLQDTLQRFKLDQDIRTMHPDWPASRLHSEFLRQYRSLPGSQAPQARLIRRIYPGLPEPVIDELLRHASTSEIQLLNEGRMPSRMGQELRHYQQQVRLARACEGLYLDTVRSWDADRLILHTLGQIPEWPADMIIELQQVGHMPAEIMRIGDSNGAPRTSILSAKDGYVVVGDTHAIDPARVHDSLFSALAAALPASVRQAIAITGVKNTQALKQMLQTRPLPERAQLRQLLRMQPVRPGYQSPMRLADGRLGYPLGGGSGAGNYIRRPTLMRMINQLGLPRHTSNTAEGILDTLERRGLSLRQVNDLLLDLLRERNTLTLYLDAWQTALRGSEANAEAILSLRERLMQCWYDHAPQLANNESPSLRLEHFPMGTFPTNLPTFFGERVTRLELIAPFYNATTGMQRRQRNLARLLEQFPGLRSLEITQSTDEDGASVRAPLHTVELIAVNLPQLESLSLPYQGLTLTGQDFEALLGMRQLRRLTLDGNQISPFVMEEFGRFTLDYLSLESMSLDSWPRSLTQRTLRQIGELSLRNNRIRSLPGFLIGNEQSTLTHTVVHLEGNDIMEDQLLRILLNHERSPERIHFDRSPSLNERMRPYTEQREQLHGATHSWANASTSTAPLSPLVMQMRNRIAMTLNAYWHGVELGSRSPLRLHDVALDQFPPRLPSFFQSQVRALSMERNSGTAAQLSAFFQRFSSVEVLTLGNYLQPDQALAATLLHLPQLTYLSLNEMGLTIDNQILAIFGQLSNLQTLELSGNHLGDITQVPRALRNLRRLDLNNMGLTQWPNWVDALLPLEVLDLSDNQLTNLPEHILSNPDTDAQVTSIALFDNPLNAETMDRARRSSATQRRFTFAFSPPGDAPAGGHMHDPFPIDTEDRPDLARWLLGNPLQKEALRDAWQRLKEAGDASNLLALVGRLQQSAPYRNGDTRVAFAERVRLVLIQALVNQEERALFEHIAQEGLVQQDTGNQTCHDGVLLVFQNLEFLIAERRLLSEHADTEPMLYQELRRLYRLSRLDEMARDGTRERDEAEVRLAYRRGANQPLKLGVPNDNMLFEAIAEVSHNELTRVIEQVLQDERGEGFLEYAVNNQEWGRYLRHAHADRFNAIERTYQANVIDLPSHYPADTPIEDLSAEFDALQRIKIEQERQLIRELTQLANPDRI
ncbi:NEL-type E3 ubiquitin ligase domain-containing protein [Pseudomonas sp. SMV7]|uniref:NEL-type E3 ubiquitin ligase domain-containing protein n=1 Tax=Pseudomonas sp. SMV7 TaxID=3390194 RepID=UPI003F82C136